MYKPQTYHHIQEIQKYNIQDYRPRYILDLSPLAIALFFFTNDIGRPEWSNSKKPFAKFAKCNACANSAAMPSRKPTSRKRESCKPTTRRGREAGMARWPAHGLRGDRRWEFLCQSLGVFYIVASGVSESCRI